MRNDTRRKQKTIVSHGGASPTNCYHATSGEITIETSHLVGDDKAEELHRDLEKAVMSVIRKHE